MMCHVSPANESNGRAEIPQDGASVLANLPRRRPQRASARRTAARQTAAPAKAAPAATDTAKAPAGKRKRTEAAARTPKGTVKAKPRAATARRPRAVLEEVPRQGFESIEERATGAVAPPGGTELVGTAAEIVSELAKAGIAGGERLLRDALSLFGR
jgi:hypothetical protein